jgi:DNA-binding transcriptional LysR family regulator
MRPWELTAHHVRRSIQGGNGYYYLRLARRARQILVTEPRRMIRIAVTPAAHAAKSRRLVSKLRDRGRAKLGSVEVRLTVSEPDDDLSHSRPFRRGFDCKLVHDAVEDLRENCDGVRIKAPGFI